MSSVLSVLTLPTAGGTLENAEKIKYRIKMIGMASHCKATIQINEIEIRMYLSRLFFKE